VYILYIYNKFFLFKQFKHFVYYQMSDFCSGTNTDSVVLENCKLSIQNIIV